MTISTFRLRSPFRPTGHQEEEQQLDLKKIHLKLKYLQHLKEPSEHSTCEMKSQTHSPLVAKVNNSTSTPLRRSILKNKVQFDNYVTEEDDSKISYSPLVLSQATQPNNTSRPIQLTSSARCTQMNGTLVGISQALRLLNSNNSTPISNQSALAIKSPPLGESPSANEAPLVITFDMKSTLHDLFADSVDEPECEDVVASKNQSDNFDFSLEMLERNEFEFKEPVSIPIDSPLLAKPKNRRLRFDEASIIETKCANDLATSNAEMADDSFQIQKKVNKKSKKLNWSSSEEETGKNESIDAEFNEIIGNNEHYMDKYADDFEYLDDEDEDEDEDVLKRAPTRENRKKKSTNLILDEADESDEDRLDDDEDEEDEDGDEYDLKDSFVDANDYSHNGNCFFFFTLILSQ